MNTHLIAADPPPGVGAAKPTYDWFNDIGWVLILDGVLGCVVIYLVFVLVGNIAAFRGAKESNRPGELAQAKSSIVHTVGAMFACVLFGTIMTVLFGLV
jgi:hypothetical protein